MVLNILGSMGSIQKTKALHVDLTHLIYLLTICIPIYTIYIRWSYFLFVLHSG